MKDALYGGLRTASTRPCKCSFQVTNSHLTTILNAKCKMQSAKLLLVILEHTQYAIESPRNKCKVQRKN